MKKTGLIAVSVLAATTLLAGCSSKPSASTSTVSSTPTTSSESSETKKTIGLKEGSGDKSKQELGTDYGMVAYASSPKECYVQYDLLAKGIQGKTVEEAQALESVSGVTIGTADLNKALANAFSKKTQVTVLEGATLKLGVGMTRDAFDAETVELGTYISGVVTDGTKVLGSSIDALFIDLAQKDDAVIVKADSQYTAKEGQTLISKNDLGDKYKMETTTYKTNTDSLSSYAKDKTLEEINALTAQTDITGVSVWKSGLVDAVKEAANYSVNPMTTKVQEGVEAIDLSITAASTSVYFGVGYQTSFKDGKLDSTVCVALFDAEGKVLTAKFDATQYQFELK